MTTWWRALTPRWCSVLATTFTSAGFGELCLGLSGGIDSALTACIAVDALGRENVIGVGMPGPYSSQGSIDDAAQLARNLGIRFQMVPIGGMFDSYTRLSARCSPAVQPMSPKKTFRPAFAARC